MDNAGRVLAFKMRADRMHEGEEPSVKNGLIFLALESQKNSGRQNQKKVAPCAA